MKRLFLLPIVLFLSVMPLFSTEGEFVTFSVKSFQTRPASTDVFYGEDVAGALNNALQGVEGLKVFERNANWTFLEELKLSMSGMTDESQTEKKAAIVSPDYFIEGEVTLSGDQMVIRARIYETSSREILYAKTVRGLADDFFDLEEELSQDIAEVFSLLDLKTKQLDTGSFERTAYDFYNQSLRNQSVEDRIALLTESLEKEPEFIQALHLLASTYDEAQMRQECLDTYLRILVLDGEDFTAHWNLGINAFKLKNYNQAREAFGKCSVLRADDPEIWYNLGVLAEFSDEGERFGPGVELVDIIPFYEKVLQVDALHENANFALGFLYGQLASFSQDMMEQRHYIENAIKYWEAFIAISPGHPQVEVISENMNVFSQYLAQINDMLIETDTTETP